MSGNSLGDFFPKEDKVAYAEAVITTGLVIRKIVYFTNGQPPKIKFFVVVGMDSTNVSLASVFINTEVNLNVNRNEYLKSLQHPIKSTNYDFLDYDSSVDCARIEEQNIMNLKKEIVENPSIVVGEMLNGCFMQIHAKCAASKIISQIHKEKYGLK